MAGQKPKQEGINFVSKLGTYAAGNLTQIKTNQFNSTTSVEKGISCIHLGLNVPNMITEGFTLVEGAIRQIVGNMITQQGWKPDASEVDDTYANILDVLALSAKAHACLLKMWQIQSGRQVTDVNGNSFGGVLFNPGNLNIPATMPENWTVINASSFEATKTATETIFDTNIGNAAWLANYVGQLDYTFTNPSIRQLLIGLFAPITQLSTGISPTTTYANVWPMEGNIGTWSRELIIENLSSNFTSAINAIKAITMEDPYIVQILSFMGYQIGSEFEFKRDQSQKSLLLNSESALIELVLSTEAGDSLTIANPTYGAALDADLDSIYFAGTDTPLAVSPFMAMDIVSLYSLINGYMHAKTVANIDLTSGTVRSRPYMANYVLTMNPSDLDMITTGSISTLQYQAALANINYINEAIADQNSMLDLDITFNVKMMYPFTNQGGGVVIPQALYAGTTVYTGFGTYVMDSDNQYLAYQSACTTMLFGATFETQLKEKLSKIPTTNIHIA